MRAIARTRIGAPAVAGAFALAAAGVLSAQALAAPARATAPAPVTVTFGEFFYKPATITVKVGQQVVFKNVGKIAHTVANSNGYPDVYTMHRHEYLERGF